MTSTLSHEKSPSVISNRLNVIFNLLKEKDPDLKWLTQDQLEILKHPKRVLSVTFPIKTKHGLKVIQGYRVQYNDALGPTKGGIRYHPNVTLPLMESLAFWMTFKNAVMDLPYGGGKGGLVLDVKAFDAEDIEQISREFIRQIHFFVGPDKDIPAPDVSTNPKIMGYMSDEFDKIYASHQSGFITGKPLSIGGSQGRSYATAMGGALVLQEVVSAYGLKKDPSVAIQGFGNAGIHMASILSKFGYRIIAISDSKSGVFCAKGLMIEKLKAHKLATGTVEGFEEAQAITKEALLSLEVDVLVPSALENAINEENIDHIKAKTIIELANGPIAPNIEHRLDEKGIIVIPDILSNAGGVTVSYFEWIQNRIGYYWTEEEVLEKLDKKMKAAFYHLKHYVDTFSINFRTAAYLYATKKILIAERDRGRI